jgi:diguanylate cyclase (GGDEF)-like protein
LVVRGIAAALARALARRKSRIARVVLCLSAVVIAGVGLSSAVTSWRAVRDADSLGRSYSRIGAGAVDELARLRSLRDRRGSKSAHKAFFAAARTEARLLTTAEAHATGGGLPRLRGLERRHTAAVTTVARALRPDSASRARFTAATELFEAVGLDAAAARSELTAAEPRPWPSNGLQRLGLADLAFVLLVGIVALGRQAFRAAGLRPGESRRHSEIERLIYVARSDSLTGLANHRAFQDDLSSAIERRNTTGVPFALLAFDLDGLKLVNDVDGHQAGDAYIKAAATCIRETVAEGGTVYRTGGDEFMAILPGCRSWEALTVAHRIQRASNERGGKRTLSIGVTESTSTEGRGALLHQADLALYEAKRGKLLAATYHDGLEPRRPDGTSTGPSEQQKALASALAQAVDSKDAELRNHSETVAELCVAIGRHLGIGGERLERLRIAGLLHDVGRIGVSEAVLAKQGIIGSSERSDVELEASVAHSILLSAGLQDEAEWVLHYHERFDGTGYPSGLTGEAIPLESRIITVADAFEALTGARSHRDAKTPAEALAELAAGSGSQFDARCVQALNDVFGGGEIVDPGDGAAAAVAVA